MEADHPYVLRALELLESIDQRLYALDLKTPTREELLACLQTSPVAPGAPSSDEPKTTAFFVDPNRRERLASIDRPEMLKASPPSSAGPQGPVALEVLQGVFWEISEALADLERLGGDAPHRMVPIAGRMKALFWMVAREVANRAYLGAWNQATDGQPVKEHHFKAFTRSVIDGQVPRAWEPK